MMPRFGSNDPWRALWQIVVGDYTLGLLLLALALALLLAAWLPQTSAGEAAVDVDWQAEVERRWGGEAWFDAVRSPLQALGAFFVADAAWFRLLLAFLALALFARLIDRAEALWVGRRMDAAPEETAWKGVEGTFEALVARLRRWRFRIATVNQEGEAEQARETPSNERSRLVRADRWPWGELGPMLVYLGGLVVLLGAAITARWGWQMGPLPLTAGERIALGHGSNLTLQLEELAQDGQRGVGKIWRDGDTLVGTGDLAQGRPLTGGGVGAYLVGSGPGLRVRATSSDAQVLGLALGPDTETREELVLAFTEDEPLYQLGVPDAKLVLLLTIRGLVGVDALPQVQVFESGSGELIVDQDASVDTMLKVDGVSINLTSIPYAQIRVVNDPGAFGSQLGVILLMAGAVLWALWPPRRLWLRHRADACGPSGKVEVAGDVGWLPPLGELASRPAQPNGSEV